MTDMSSYVGNFCDQWAAILSAKLCIASNRDPQTLEKTVSGLARSSTNEKFQTALMTGYQMSKVNTPEQVSMMGTSIQNLIYQFKSDQIFSKLFSSIYTYADLILSAIVDTTSRSNRALHTDKIIQEENLSPLDQLNCDTFVYISSLLDYAAQSGQSDVTVAQIDINIAVNVFKYVDHSLPNTVRASAGKILCAISTSPKHCQAISDFFWKTFNACKKDDEFRNFASYIDGVEDLQLSLATPELAAAATNFLTSFTTNAKKIERGVLRMKFLVAMISIVTKLCKCENASANQDFVRLMNEVWTIVVKWSSKAKHTLFCLDYLQKMAAVMHPDFFIVDHGKQLFDLVFKCIKDTKGDVEILRITRDLIIGLHEKYCETQFADFKAQIENGLNQAIFKITPKTHQPKFLAEEQTQLIVEIYVEVGRKKFLPVVDLCRAIFHEPDPLEAKNGRAICIRVLGNLSKYIPDTLVKYNEELYQYIQPMLMQTTPNPEETKHAILTFPLLYSPDDNVLAKASQTVFEISLSDERLTNSPAYLSIISYIEKLISFKRNPKTVIEYIYTLTNAITTLPKEEISKKLDFLIGITKSFNVALTKEQNLEEIKTGNVAILSKDWVEFRTKYDEALLTLIVYPDEEVVKKVREIEAVFITDAYAKLDTICLPAPVYNLCHLLEEEKGDIIRSLPKLAKSHPKICEDIFDSLVTTWKEYQGKYDNKYRGRFLMLLGSMARPNSQQLKIYLEELFGIFKKMPVLLPAISSVELINPALWVVVINELNSYLTTSSLTIPAYWTAYTNIYFAIASNAAFQEQLNSNPKLVELYEKYIAAIWHQQHDVTNSHYFATCEKAMKIINLYVSLTPTHFSKVLEPKREAYGQFLDALRDMVKFESYDKFPPTFLETYLKTLETVFSYSTFTDPSIFDDFSAWLELFSNKTMANEQLQTMIVRALEVALAQNPIFIQNYFLNSVTPFGLFSSQVILAMANVFVSTEGEFESKFKNGNAVVLATVLLHLKNDDPLPRQAAHKLMCILITRSSIFTTKAPTYLMMSLTSHSASGYVTQASHFTGFASKYISSQLATDVFRSFSSNFKKMKEFQQQLLLMLTAFLRLFVVECPFEEAVLLLLKITGQSDFTDAEISGSISVLWTRYFRLVEKDSVVQVISEILKYGTSQKNLKSVDTFASINVLVFAFQVFPEDVCRVLFGTLCKYDKPVPDSYENFIQLVSKPTVDFKVTDQEIIAANAMSQILLSIESKDDFEKMITPKLAPLTFYAAIMFDQDEFAITPFHQLFDAILNTALFRFAETPALFSSNLAQLQAANLVMRASSLDQQYEIFMGISASKHIIAYDQVAVRTFSELFCQLDPKFKSKFFSIVLANTFMVTDNARTMEPFLILMALIDELETRNVINLMLFSVCAFKNGRAEIVDSIIDIVKQRMLSPDLPEQTFVDEAASIISCFFLFLSLDCRRSLSIHIVKIIADICARVLQVADKAVEVSKELCGFLDKFGGDEYIGGLFVKFIDETQTLGDPSVDEMIRCLDQVARVIAIASGSLNNWCYILGVLLEGYRHFLAILGQRPTKDTIPDIPLQTVDEFAKYIAKTITDQRQRHFVVEFFVHGFNSFKTIDLYRDNAAIMIIESFLRQSKMNLNPNLFDNLVKATLLLSVACDEAGKVEAAHLIRVLINLSNHQINSQYLSYGEMKPKFVEATLKPIGYYTSVKKNVVAQESLPSCRLFKAANATQDVIKILMEHLKVKLSAC